jgi:glutamyl-tRNA reductase
MEIVLVGLNHRTATVELRERVSFTADQARSAADQLRERGILSETLVLSTCNRSEVYGVPPESMRECAPALSSFLSSFHSLRSDALGDSLYHHYDQAAVRHLFRVAAGLDSMMLGEAEILGQVREAYRAAHDHHATGPVLNRLFQGALEVGKRVRSETDLGTRPMSVASAGVKLAERIFGKLHDRAALVLGAGEISEQVVSQLCDRGIGHLSVMNRSRDRAEVLAKKFNGKIANWGDWDAALVSPDVLVCSVSSDEPVLKRDVLERVMQLRENRALFIMDLGLPRNVEPSAASLYNLYLYTLDDLSDVVQQNRAARQGEVPRAESIVDEHVGKFLSWQASVEIVSLVEDLRGRMKAERSAFLRDRLAGFKNLDAADLAHLETLLDDLLESLVIAPAERMRSEKELRRKIRNAEALRDLFLPNREKP